VRVPSIFSKDFAFCVKIATPKNTYQIFEIDFDETIQAPTYCLERQIIILNPVLRVMNLQLLKITKLIYRELNDEN